LAAVSWPHGGTSAVTARPPKKAIDRLGAELRGAGAPSAAAMQALQAWRALHLEALGRVRERLREDLNLEPGTRLKTTLTILDKLRRMPEMELSRMQDIAGVWVMGEMRHRKTGLPCTGSAPSSEP
jgi:hypothetical protein